VNRYWPGDAMHNRTSSKRASKLGGTSKSIERCLKKHVIAEKKVVDWNRIEGNWKQTTGKIKEKWGKLTDDDLTQINGKREQFEGKIQERYGLAKDKVRTDVDTWLNSLD
jgi:uncharacterized protein YjbJ (UPF0337 family)